VDQVEIFERLGLALAVGALIGLERGWHEREAPEGLRVAGARTFCISALLGAVASLLAQDYGPLFVAVAFAAFAATMIAFRLRLTGESHDYGVTTVITGFLTFSFGAMVMQGYVAAASASAVVLVLILGLKPVVHEWVRKVSYEELIATFKLLAISVVILPVLPNERMGPWDAFNPFEFWLLVVMISLISFLGYLILRLTGDGRGIILGGLAGGLLSSTAVAVSFSRRAREDNKAELVYAAGIVAASAVMFLRLAVVTGAVAPALLPVLALPLAAGLVVGLGGAHVLWRRSGAGAKAAGELTLSNPLELGTAIRFGVLLAVIMVAARAVEATVGPKALYALAALSGLADVDAIALTLAQMTRTGLALALAAGAIILAALVNTGVKIAICFIAGTARLGTAVLLMLGASFLAAGGAALLLTP